MAKRKRTSHTIVCEPDDRLAVEPSNCPEVSQHEPMPAGYVDRAGWAMEKAKTHRQVRCSGCGLFMVWRPRKAA